jgi:hypothetical protein
MNSEMKKTPSALKWLAESRGRAAGELDRLETIQAEVESKIQEVRQNLEAFDRAIKVFDPRIDPDAIEP